ncbi:MAG: Rrf2 family transcriptional regulator [Planctomycetia bacterium]|nr:Rrf2 family transcriptional regulator [Planctomycetia bacterium]
MKITAQEEYGLRCLLQIARAGEKNSLSIAEIAEREGLSTPYAAKMLSLLRQVGFIDSTLGRSGGYKLAKPPHELGLGTVLLAIGERLFEESEYCQKHAGTETEGTCVHHSSCNLRSLWQTLESCMQHILDGLTLADLLDDKTHWATMVQQRLAMPIGSRGDESRPRPAVMNLNIRVPMKNTVSVHSSETT